MKKFVIPENYRSGTIGRIKEYRKNLDPRKKDFTPSVLDFGPVVILIPRHFGFCYGVENAIEISYKALDENPDKRIFLLSQMIHNPVVNSDLEERGIRFIMDTEGNQFVKWDELRKEDIVIIPAFGTTVEIETLLTEKGIEIQKYNTTCPFVEKVWKRSNELGGKNFTVIIHGKHNHEETRASFSHSMQKAPTIIIRDMDEAIKLAEVMTGAKPREFFFSEFATKYSDGFDPSIDLQRVGVVNQTTMLATETQAISDFLKDIIIAQHGTNYKEFFADTRDTLCYATNDNQQATLEAQLSGADLAITAGGYNSSNTSQLVNILAEKMPSFFIVDEKEIESKTVIHHYNYAQKKMVTTQNWLADKNPLKIVLTSGASCPDRIVEAIFERILTFFPDRKSEEEIFSSFS